MTTELNFSETATQGLTIDPQIYYDDVLSNEDIEVYDDGERRYNKYDIRLQPFTDEYSDEYQNGARWVLMDGYETEYFKHYEAAVAVMGCWIDHAESNDEDSED